MDRTQEDKIRDRAYALWQRDGSPEGRQDEYWHRAERELAEEDSVDTSEDNATVSPIPLVPGSVPMG